MLRFRALFAPLLAALCCASASAQTYPTGRVTMLVVTAAGGPLDAAARLLAEQLQARFNQPFIVENRPGGGSRIAIDARAAHQQLPRHRRDPRCGREIARPDPEPHEQQRCRHAGAPREDRGRDHDGQRRPDDQQNLVIHIVSLWAGHDAIRHRRRQLSR